MIRDEVKQLGAELSGLGNLLLDDKSNKEQMAEILDGVFGLVKEGLDFAALPKEERAKAIGHAVALAGAAIADQSIQYSDETIPA